MKINNVAIHKIIENPDYDKDKDKEFPFKPSPASRLHPNNDPMYKLCKIVDDRINSVGRGSSKFKDPNSESGAVSHFSNLLTDVEDFLQFSNNILNIMASVMPATATENYIAFIDYEKSDTHYVIVCVLKLEDGVTIDEGSMEVVDVTSIQKKNIHEGSRITLDGINTHKKNNDAVDYILWIKTSQKLSNYFQNSFNIDQLIDDKKETGKLRKALDQYIDDTIDNSTLEADRKSFVREKLREETYGHIHQVASNNDALDFEGIERITDTILSTNGIDPARSFTEHINEFHPLIPNLFKPFDGATKTWGKLKTIVKSQHNHEIKIEIDRAILTEHEYIDIDRENKEITIKRLSDSFMNSLK